jgi:hypothetical protein
VYTGISNGLGRGGWDNTESLINQAVYRGMNTRFRYVPTDSSLEARAQELYLLLQ